MYDDVLEWLYVKLTPSLGDILEIEILGEICIASHFKIWSFRPPKLTWRYAKRP